MTPSRRLLGGRLETDALSSALMLRRPEGPSRSTRAAPERFKHPSRRPLCGLLRMRPVFPNGPSTKHPLALLVDDLAALGEREFHRVVERGKTVGADELVLLALAADLLLDRARGLILALALVGRGVNHEAVVFDRLRRRRRSARLGRTAPAEQLFPKRHGTRPEFVNRIVALSDQLSRAGGDRGPSVFSARAIAIRYARAALTRGERDDRRQRRRFGRARARAAQRAVLQSAHARRL